jgi:hypothetical protein
MRSARWQKKNETGKGRQAPRIRIEGVAGLEPVSVGNAYHFHDGKACSHPDPGTIQEAAVPVDVSEQRPGERSGRPHRGPPQLSAGR